MCSYREAKDVVEYRGHVFEVDFSHLCSVYLLFVRWSLLVDSLQVAVKLTEFALW